MKTAEVFPIELRARETEHHTSSPFQFRSAFLKAKPADMRWYEFDVIIKSRTHVEFVAYDIRDTVFGGIGREIWRGTATVPASLTNDDVERAIHRAARYRREEEIAAAEAAIVAGYADEIRAELSVSA